MREMGSKAAWSAEAAVGEELAWHAATRAARRTRERMKTEQVTIASEARVYEGLAGRDNKECASAGIGGLGKH